MNTQSVKNITSIEELLFLYDSLINDGHVITVVNVKNSLKLPSDLSQKFMNYYYGNRKDQLSVTYLVEGYKKDSNEYICAILTQKEVLELQKEQNEYSIKIYSIQSNKSKIDLSVLWKQEINELNKVFENTDLKNQLLIPQFSDIILGDLEVKNVENNLNSQHSFLQNEKEIKDNNRKINVKETDNNKNKDDNNVDKKIDSISEYKIKDRIDDERTKTLIKKEIHIEDKDSNESEQLKKNIENDYSKIVNSFRNENSNLSNDSDNFKQSSNVSNKRKLEDSNSYKIKRENLTVDSVNNEINKPICEVNSKTMNKSKPNKSENETLTNNILIKKEKKIDESNKNRIETKLKKTKLEIKKTDVKPELFQSDSSDDNENKILEENEKPLKTFPKIKSVKETQMFYENGYLVTVDKDSCIHIDSSESNNNDPKKVIKDTTSSNNKKRKNLQQTLLTNFFKKKK
ncbi:conserved Plasmodium protein, unknown function [Plasmodium gallinaceum]|uniref:DNA polymerase delta subunit 3 n=1 Tax=Plasmodium gallinaceum TaxID=5849 RepID=A0A1J1GLG3_PLAGA|nr:conserved Plasmodium protein, unknown function [Plasmodium gallinaceum]CRG93045.1 conserved Plasmodium protein, unknown function [Plasmodium gallinaceum]